MLENLTHLNNYLGTWEPTWLFGVLFFEAAVAFLALGVSIWALIIGRESLKWIVKEFVYDEEKDLARKQRKTKTTKKTTTQPGGASIVEEATEISENMPDAKGEVK